MIGEPDAGKPHVRFDEGVQEACDTSERRCQEFCVNSPAVLMFRADYTGCTRAEDKALRRRNLSAGSAAGIRRDRAQLVPASCEAWR